MNGNDKTNTVKDLEKIDIISLEDKKIKLLGELLSNDTSRIILRILSDKVMSVNEIAQNTKLSLPLVIYHLKKLQSMNLVKTIKENVFDDKKHYTLTKFALVVLPSSVPEDAKRSKSLSNSLRRIYRLSSVGICAFISWVILENVLPQPSMMRIPVGSGLISEGLFWSTTIALLIIIGGLGIELHVLSRRHRNCS